MKIGVIGSVNMDYFIETDRFPESGETVLGKSFFMSLGGKGANQAVAASRLGGDVTFFASVGDDLNSNAIKENLRREKIDLSFLQSINNCAAGTAFIEISKGNNRIIVVPGANRYTNISYSNAILEKLLSLDVILFQMETPIELIELIIPILNDAGKITIVNPAPAHKLDQNVIDKITYITPNEHEYEIVLDSSEGMNSTLKKYRNKLIITCGENGVKYFDGEKIITVPVISVEPVDTTGAGDTFCGAFAVALAEKKELYDSIMFGNVAAGLSIMKKGAQSGMPSREDVDVRMKEFSNENKDQLTTD